MSRPYRRKDLKHDEFVGSATRLSNWLMQRRHRIGWTLLVVVVSLALVAAVRYYQQRQEERAAGLLAVALEIYRSPIVDGPSDDGGGNAGAAMPGDEHGPVGHRHFSSEQQRREAARQEFEAIFQQYGRRASGKIAAYYLGLVEAELGNVEAAAAALQSASETSKELIAAMALYRLGQLHLEARRSADAVEVFDRLLARRGGVFPREEVLMAKARAHEASGDQQAALAAYQQVVDNHSGSFAAIEARTRVEELAAQLGLDPNADQI